MYSIWIYKGENMVFSHVLTMWDDSIYEPITLSLSSHTQMIGIRENSTHTHFLNLCTFQFVFRAVDLFMSSSNILYLIISSEVKPFYVNGTH